MSYSIEGRAFKLDDLKQHLDAEFSKAGTKFQGKMPPSEFLAKTMEKFGKVIGEHLVIIDNEYWEEFNPLPNYVDLFRRYYEDSTAGHALLRAPHTLIPASTYAGANEMEFEGVQFPAEDD